MHQMKLMNAYRLQSIQVSPTTIGDSGPATPFGGQQNQVPVVTQKPQISRTTKAKKIRTMGNNPEAMQKRYDEIFLDKIRKISRTRKDDSIQEPSFGASNQFQNQEEGYKVTGWDTKFGHGKPELDVHQEDVYSHQDPHEESWNHMHEAGAKLQHFDNSTRDVLSHNSYVEDDF